MFFTWWEIRETNTTCKALKDGIWIAVHITVFDSCMGTKIDSSRFITLSVWECLIICNFGLFFIMDVTFPRLVWSLSWSLLLVDGDLAGGFNSVSLESEGSGGPLCGITLPPFEPFLELPWSSCLSSTSKANVLPIEATQLNWSYCHPIKKRVYHASDSVTHLYDVVVHEVNCATH